MNDSFSEQKWLQTANGKICYFSNRSFPDHPTVVFLHGLSSNHTTWKALVRGFDRYRLNYLLLDWRGHGYSDKTKQRNLYRFPIFRDDLKKILAQENLSEAILAGYSYGGFIALDFAIEEAPFVAGLVLISTNHVNPFKYKKINFLTPLAKGGLNLLAWLCLWQKRKEYYYFDQDSSKGYWDSTFKGYTTMPLSINFWMLAEIANLDFSQKLGQIGCPTLMIKSQADPFLSDEEAADMARKIKSSKLVIMEEPSHFLASRYQGKVRETIINFFREKNLI